MSLSEHISSVIKSARKLKKIADETGNIELKSQLLDEIDKLQELREALAESGELAQFHPPQETAHTGPAPFVQEPESSDVAHIIQPAAAGETYDIHSSLDDDDDDPDRVALSDDASEQQAERFHLAETILRKLEPKHQAILKKMNDVLTEEQQFRKQTLTREGQAAGKPSNQIQQEVMAALDLTDKQRQLLATARKELHDIREEIAQQLDGLLTDDQRRRLQKKILKEIAAGK
jgi:hypothetical protein